MEAVGVYESKIIRYNPNKLISHMVREDKKALQAKVFDSIEKAKNHDFIYYTCAKKLWIIEAF